MLCVSTCHYNFKWIHVDNFTNVINLIQMLRFHLSDEVQFHSFGQFIHNISSTYGFSFSCIQFHPCFHSSL
jgi:hypothetical protein